MLTVNSSRFSSQFPEDIKQELLILFPVSILFIFLYIYLYFSICSPFFFSFQFFSFSNELIFAVLCNGIDKALKVKFEGKKKPQGKNRKNVTYENIFFLVCHLI